MTDSKKPPEKTTPNDYEVGFAKPPIHTQFKPGCSGNPRGRPKGTKNLKTDLMEELGEKIVIREGERSRKLSKQRALLKSVVNRAIKGDARATAIALSTMMRLIDTGEGAPTADEVLLDDELDVLRNFQERLLRDEAGGATNYSKADDSPEEES